MRPYHLSVVKYEIRVKTELYFPNVLGLNKGQQMASVRRLMIFLPIYGQMGSMQKCKQRGHIWSLAGSWAFTCAAGIHQPLPL